MRHPLAIFFLLLAGVGFAADPPALGLGPPPPNMAAATGTLAATNGGTAQSTWTLGDLLYGSGTNTLAKLAGQTTSAKQFLTQTGTGTVSAIPAWAAIVAGDVPSLDAGKITTGQLAVARGGSGVDASAAANGTLLIGNGTGYTLATVTGTANQVTVTNGAGTITLATPQSIDSAASPTFASETLTANLSLTGAASLATVGGNTATGPKVIVNGAAGNNRILEWQTAGSTRWQVYASNSTESGSSAGSNLNFSAFTDAAGFIDTPLSITRASGGVILVTRSISSNQGISGGVTTLTSGTTALGVGTCTAILDGTTATVTITLPAANAFGVSKGQILFIHCLNATNTVTVNRAGSDTITGPAGVGVTTFTMSTNTGFDFRSDGSSKWYYH